MATTERKRFKNINKTDVDKSKKWIRENPTLARMSEKEIEYFNIDVFSNWNHRKIADDLYKSLKDSGFLEKYGLYSIKISPINK